MNSSLIGIEKTYWLVSFWQWAKANILFIKKKEYVNDMYADRIWTNIEEMPIWNWNKIIETNDLAPWIFKSSKGEYSERLNDFWLDLQQQHIDEFGIDDMLRRRISLMIKLTKLNLKYAKTKERVLLNFIEIAEMELQQMSKSNNIRFYKVLDVLTTHKKMSIDPKTFPVVQWYHALKNMADNGR